MSQKRHEKVLRRKARMGSRAKKRKEDRRKQRVEERRADFEAVFGSLLHGQVVEGASSNCLGSICEDGLAAVHGKAGEGFRD